MAEVSEFEEVFSALFMNNSQVVSNGLYLSSMGHRVRLMSPMSLCPLQFLLLL